MKLIVGLGNPGKEYQRTRHNVGFIFLDKLMEKFEFPEFKTDKQSNAQISKGTINRKRVILAKPLTYMNNSGQAVQSLLAFYKLKPADLVVAHDDKDIPLGNFRVQSNRGSAGHNGIKSIFDHLGTKDFKRLRVGVAPETEIHDTADFVLGTLTPPEQKKLGHVYANLILEVENLVNEV